MRRKINQSRNAAPSKVILFLAAPETQILDVAGPFQIFVRAAEIYVRENPSQGMPYDVRLLSCTAGACVKTNCGLELGEAESFHRFRGAIDTLLIAGGRGVERAAQSKELLAWLRRNSARARRLGSICTGAFLLASAGLLDGKLVTTHWMSTADLARKFPNIKVDPDPIFVRDGNMYTSAGVTAGMDLALALVEEDLGLKIALRVAREMVLYLRRPGSQSQFSTALSLQTSDRKQIEEIRSWAIDNLGKDLAVQRLAAKAGMSPRNFARVFAKDTGTTPARFVERLRVEAARRRLEETRDKLEKIAGDCGFGSSQGLRRSFLRVLRVQPVEYRRRFARMRADFRR
jgi:transcriptional regulator GlxA family with amidase domain